MHVRKYGRRQQTKGPMDRNQAEKMSQAADRITEAVQEFTSTINRFLEYQRELDRRREAHEGYAWSSGRSEPDSGPLPGLPDKEAVAFALKASQEVREEMGRGLDPESKRPTPSPEEVRTKREERRKREAEERP